MNETDRHQMARLLFPGFDDEVTRMRGCKWSWRTIAQHFNDRAGTEGKSFSVTNESLRSWFGDAR